MHIFKKRRDIKSIIWIITAVLLFSFEWVLMVCAPSIHYNLLDPTIEVDATVIDKPEDIKETEYDFYITYEYEDQQYSIGYDNYHINYESLSTGEIFKIKIHKKQPEKLFISFEEEIFLKINRFYRILIFATAAVLMALCTGTKFKRFKNPFELDDQWIRKYIIKRELLHTVMTSTAIMMVYFIGGYTINWLWFVPGGYIIFRAFVRIITVCFKPTAVTAYVSPCKKVYTKEEGRDLDSTSPIHHITTNLEKLTFSGYGRSTFFCANINDSNNLLVVRLNSFYDPYIICKLADNSEWKIENSGLPYRMRFPHNLLTLVILVLLAIVLNNVTETMPQKKCQHEFHTLTIIQPNTEETGLEKARCAKCLYSEETEIPKLDNIVDVRVTDKELFRDHGVLDNITYTIELKNTGTIPISEITIKGNVYNSNGKLGEIFATCQDVILQPEQQYSFTTREYDLGNMGLNLLPSISIDLEKNEFYQIAQTDINDLTFDFSATYSVHDGTSKDEG